MYLLHYTFVSHKRFEESYHALNVFNRSDHGNVLIWPHDNDSTMLRINAERLVSVAMAIVVALVVHKDFMRDCLLSAQMHFKTIRRLTRELPLAIRKSKQLWYLQGAFYHRIIDGDALAVKHKKWLEGSTWFALGQRKQRCQFLGGSEASCEL